MKKVYFFFLVIISVFCSAQMDTEHWFAPMGCNYPSTKNFQALYLSTGETTAFKVKIYNGSTELSEVEISKGNPVTYTIPRELIITEEDGDRMTVLTKGLHLVGEKKFFANLRFAVENHAEIVTSKGRAGLGQTFFLGMPSVIPGSSGAISNHTISVIATENGTNITLSGYDPSLVFTNDSNLSAEKTVTLNKGESYIFEVNNDVQNLQQGLIGAKIESDKPISVSSGSFSGRIGNTGVDNFMDQSIPIDKTGDRFIVMSGNGAMPNSVMEMALVIAAEDDVDVFLNDNPYTMGHLANAGDYFFVDSSHYLPLSAANNIYGVYINTSKKVYVYQILAGSSGNELPSGGMNLIPGLSCFLPSNIDELSKVDENPVFAYANGQDLDYYETHDVKLNIIAQSGSDLLINGSKTGLIGPFSIAGNTEWELYSFLDARGNITVNNNYNKAITAGIAGGSGPVGFGGYFAGFSSVPSISKSGDCANGQRLEVDDIYDEYKWEFSLDNITWGALPAGIPDNVPSINPGGNFGYYRCTVTKYSCLPQQTTKEFKFLKCPQTKTVSYTIGHCGSITPITPTFTDDPSMLVNITKTAIIEKPSSGNAYVDSSGNIIFEANDTSESQVTFKYYFESYGDFPDSEEVTVIINIAQIIINNPEVEITACLDEYGLGKYRLTKFEDENPGHTKYEYYTDSGYTQMIPASEIENYFSEPGKTVYVKVYNTYNCYKTAKITLKTYELPSVRVEIIGQQAVVYASGGTAPYYYRIVGKDYDQNSGGFVNSNSFVFENVPYGINTAFVISADQCLPSEKEFTVIRTLNVITPNGDGYNDTLDYSDLLSKEDAVLKIFDRFGSLIFTGGTSNSFIWNGTINGRPAPTASYWYILQWRDPESSHITRATGWILVKNRN
ncbi:MAG: T9SS type B sorting domain-containing protein [Bergeyella sp.]